MEIKCDIYKMEHVLISHMYVWYSVANGVHVNWFGCMSFICLCMEIFEKKPWPLGFAFEGVIICWHGDMA